jgi:hypothetical protein
MDKKKLQDQAEEAVELSDELLDGAAGGQYVAQEMGLGTGKQENPQDLVQPTRSHKSKSAKDITRH